MLVSLPRHRDPGPSERGDVEIPGRAARARQIRLGADRVTERADPLGALAAETQTGAEQDRPLDAEPAHAQPDHVQVEIDQARPGAGIDLAELIGIARE